MKNVGRDAYICLQKLQQIAFGTALMYGLELPPREEITHEYFAATWSSMPLITRNERGTLWVDKFYVAYQLGTGNVHYTYLTKHHIREEIYGIHEAEKSRGIELKLPKDIQRCFREANKKMLAQGKKYWIDRRWEKDEKNFRKCPDVSKCQF